MVVVCRNGDGKSGMQISRQTSDRGVEVEMVKISRDAEIDQ
jgi:hypothetical protein